MSIKEGLSHNYVNSILQDSIGLIWLSTRNGIDSYDGSQFKNYKLTDNNLLLPENLNSNLVILDNEKKIWAGTSRGLFLYNRLLDTFEKVTFTKQNDFNFSQIFTIYEDNDGRFWVGTGNALFQLNHQELTADKIYDLDMPVIKILKLSAYELLFATKKNIFIYHTQDSLIRNITKDIKQKVAPNTEKLNFSELFIDSLKQLYVFTIEHGVQIFDSKLNKVSSIPKIESIGNHPLHVGNIIKNDSGNFIISVFSYGLLKIDTNFNILEASIIDDDDNESLKSLNISDIMYDRNGRLWVTTLGAGISVQDPFMFSYSTFVHEKNRPETLGNNIGRAVLQDLDRNIWFGTKRGISIYSPTVKTWRHVYNQEKNNQVLYGNNISSLCQINSNEIWISCFDHGINIYRVDENKFYKIEELYPIKDVDLSMVSKIFIDSQQSIWIGRLRENNLLKLDLKPFLVTEYPMKNITTIYESPSKIMYLSNSFKLWTINNMTNLISMDEFGRTFSQTIRVITAINEYRDSLIIIGTDGNGIYFFNKESMKIENLSKKEGLPSNNISSIIIHNDKLWISTILGITKYNIKDKSIANFTIANGLKISSFTPNNAILTSDRELIFGGEEGYIKVNPDFFNSSITNPTLHFTNFKVNKTKSGLSTQNSPLQKNLNFIDKIVLKYHQNSFDFEFASINFSQTTQDYFTWKLDNFDIEWSEVTQNKLASYTNIPRGNYTFYLKLVTPEGIADMKKISITIQAPWWISPLALVAYVLFLLSILYVIFYINNIRFKAKQSSDKISFFIDLAHELRTPLTLIQSPLSQLLANNYLAEKDKKFLNMAIKNATKIHNYFNQLLDFQKVDMNMMKVNYKKSDIVSHVQEICKNFDPLIAEKSIRFNIFSQEASLEFYYDPIIIEKIIYNLMTNAIKYCNDHGEISIRIKIANNNCMIKVSDNGIGIPANQQKNIFKRYFRASNSIQSQISGIGIGLMLVKQLVEIIDGKINFTSSEGVGTVFTLVLKILNSPQNDNNYETVDPEYLPITQSIISENDIKTEPNMGLSSDKKKKPKILIAEDNTDLREFLFDSFSNSYNVITCENGLKALEISKTHDINIIVSDIMMPVMDGRVLCREIKTNIETCHIPIILLTALTDKDYRIEGYEAGADGYIEKPFDINLLRSRIENLIQTRKLLKNKFVKHDDLTDHVDFQNNIDSIFIKKAYDLIETNLNNPDFNIDVFCKEMLVSRSILYRKIKALTDLSPLEFITISRLKYSIKLLKTGKYSIKEISYMSGFSGPRYYSTIFKKYFKKTPSLYLKTKGQEN